MTKCKCGCGQSIVNKPHHKYYGTPKYLPKHINRGVLKTKRITTKCKCCGKKITDMVTHSRKFCSLKCYWKYAVGKSQPKVCEQGKINIREAKIGNKNPNWQGGKTTEIPRIRQCLETKLWRYAVFTKDGFTCQKCKKKGAYIQAHHIKPFAIIIKEYGIKTLEDAQKCEELWDINNGKTLCKKCHEKENKGRGTINGSKEKE